MKFSETKIKGAFVIEPERLEDERGFFARTWCEKEFKKHRLNSRVVQCSISFNERKGTLRGMHFQIKPHQETKLVRCTKGSIYDVIIDLRKESETFKEWIAVELTAENRKMLYIPEGLAHGFQTLDDRTEVFYQMSEFYHPESLKGIKWNDAAFCIPWPIPVEVISKQDQNFGDFNKLFLGFQYWTRR